MQLHAVGGLLNISEPSTTVGNEQSYALSGSSLRLALIVFTSPFSSKPLLGFDSGKAWIAGIAVRGHIGNRVQSHSQKELDKMQARKGWLRKSTVIGIVSVPFFPTASLVPSCKASFTLCDYSHLFRLVLLTLNEKISLKWP